MPSSASVLAKTLPVTGFDEKIERHRFETWKIRVLGC